MNTDLRTTVTTAVYYKNNRYYRNETFGIPNLIRLF